ncbi:MAG: hypothetical protein AAF387_09800 [Pseudomonadota bacterium]
MRFTVLIFTLVFVKPAVIAAEIRSAGSVDLPGLTFSEFDKEPENAMDPFDRSIVSVNSSGSDSGALYSYSASSDIGLGELKAFGSLNNSGGDLSSIEIGLVSANALLRDTITIESTSTEDYDVTYEFQVDGLTDFSGGSGSAGASISTGSFSNQNDFFRTTLSQTINETLSVTRTYNGTVEQRLTLQVFLQLSTAGAGGNLFADLSNTATLNIILPQDVSITNSESGTFLEVITPIPVPMMLPLVAAIAAWLSTRRLMRSR